MYVPYFIYKFQKHKSMTAFNKVRNREDGVICFSSDDRNEEKGAGVGVSDVVGHKNGFTGNGNGMEDGFSTISTTCSVCFLLLIINFSLGSTMITAVKENSTI